MTDGGKMYSNLVFAPGARKHSQKRERLSGFGTGHHTRESFYNEELRAGRSPIDPNAIFDGNYALLIFAKGQFNDAGLVRNMPVNDREIFFFHRTRFPQLAKFTSSRRIFRHESHAARFAIETINNATGAIRPQI